MEYIGIVATVLASIFYFMYNREKRETNRLKFDLKEKDMEYEQAQAKKAAQEASDAYTKDHSAYNNRVREHSELLARIGMGKRSDDESEDN